MAKNTNAFALFEIEPDFQINFEQLDKQYFAKLAQVHPDKYVNRPASEQEEAQQKAAALTEAYETLKSNYKRAHELLAIHGVKYEAQLEQEFLLETMEWRETLMDTSSLKEALTLEAQMKETLKNYWQEIETAFADKKPDIVVQILLRVKFIERFIEEIINKADEF